MWSSLPRNQVKGPVAGISVVLNFNADRALISHMPRRPPGVATEPERWLEVLQRIRPSWCHLHPGPRVAGVLEAARAQGTRVALDVNLEEVDECAGDVVRSARLADLFLPNEDELRRLTSADDVWEAVELAAGWCPRLVVKRGAKGVIAIDDGRATEVTDGLEDVVVRDRTGAGDAFAGAMVGKLAAGRASSRRWLPATRRGHRPWPRWAPASSTQCSCLTTSIQTTSTVPDGLFLRPVPVG
jgi:sugar/nucleoside kinase (ribokinase family)